MMCGSKCFVVKVELNGEQLTKKVNARTPVNARKVVRGEYGADAKIISAIVDKKNY